MARLIFQLGDGKTVDFKLSAAVVTLGRSTSNDIVINNGWISSHHAKFERSGGNIAVTSLGTLHGVPIKEYKRVGGVYSVTDLDSHNGIMVNGQRVSSKELKSGDVVAFGQLEAVFEESVEPPSTPPAETVPPEPEPLPPTAPPPIPTVQPSATVTSPPRPVTQRLVKQPPPPPAEPPPLPSTRQEPATAPAPIPVPEHPTPYSPPSPASVPSAPPAPAPPEPAPPEPAPPEPAPPEPAPPEPAPLEARRPAEVAPSPVTARMALASIQRDVALLEKTLGELQEGTGSGPEPDHALAKGLIQRIDLLEDLMIAGEKSIPGLAAQLVPLHESLLQLLRDHSIVSYTVQVGQPLDVATRKRITIVEAASEGEGITEIAEVFRPGYHFTRGPGDLPAVILRKAEVRTLRRPPV